MHPDTLTMEQLHQAVALIEGDGVGGGSCGHLNQP